MRSLTDFIGAVVLSILITFILFNLLTAIDITRNRPEGFYPGMHVVFLEDETNLVNGRLCQQTFEGYVAYTGPKDYPRWWAATPGFFASRYIISVTDKNGGLDWYPMANLEPYQGPDTYCSDVEFLNP